jgi:hypothetical protein
MSQRMTESVSQHNDYRDQGMRYMASQATTSKTDKVLFHDSHLQLQEGMRNPIAFHAEMIVDIMYLQQALRQPDAKEFSMQSSRKLMDMWTATTGHFKKETKSLKMFE